MSSCAVHRCRRSYEIASANYFFLQCGGNRRSIWIDWLRVFCRQSPLMHLGGRRLGVFDIR